MSAAGPKMTFEVRGPIITGYLGDRVQGPVVDVRQVRALVRDGAIISLLFSSVEARLRLAFSTLDGADTYMRLVSDAMAQVTAASVESTANPPASAADLGSGDTPARCECGECGHRAPTEDNPAPWIHYRCRNCGEVTPAGWAGRHGIYTFVGYRGYQATNPEWPGDVKAQRTADGSWCWWRNALPNTPEVRVGAHRRLSEGLAAVTASVVARDTKGTGETSP